MESNFKDFDKIRYVQLEAGVRYWEDADINGVEDVDLCEAKEPTAPRMPFAIPTGEKTNIAPYGEYMWKILINVKTGNIVDWPVGTTADVHYKTCDENVVTFCDENKEPISDRYECYVPHFLSPGGDGYGDYIILTVEENGHITNFRFNEEDAKETIRNAF